MLKKARQSLHKYGWVIFLFFLLIIFSWPYLFLSKTPFPSSYQINHFQPWSNIQEFWGPVKNGAMPDIVDQIYPWRHFSVDSWKKGEVAFWNPNNFAGTPHLANFQSAVFSPVNIVLFLAPFLQGWTILIILQPFLAAVGMFLLLRSFDRSQVASLLGGVAFSFCGFIVVWMAYGTLAMAISFLPLILYLLKRFSDERKHIFGLCASLLLMLSFFSGHFQTSLYLVLYTLAFVIFLERKNIFSKKTLHLLGFIVLGVIFSLIQILPTIQFYLLSVRSDSFIAGGGVPFGHLVTLVAPDFFGNPVTRNDWVGSYAEWALFVGIVPLFLAFLSLLKIKNQPAVRFGWIMAVIVLVLAISSPLQELIGSLHLPVISTSNPSRIVVLLSFSLAFLSGFGMDILVSILRSNKIKPLLIPVLIVLFMLAVVWIFLLKKPFPAEYTNLAMKNFALPTVIFFATVCAVFLSYFFRKNKKVFIVLPLVLLFLTVFDSLRFGMKWMPVDPQDKVFVDLPVVKAMQEKIGNGRMFGNLGAQINTYYNVPGIEGYDPLYVGRYGEFIAASADGRSLEAERSVVKIPRENKYIDRVIDLLGVTLIFHPIADTNQAWAYPVWSDLKRFEEVYKDQNFQLFSNNNVIKRGTLYFDYEVIPDDVNILERFYADDFDYRKKLILEEKPTIIPAQGGSGTVDFVRDDPMYLAFNVNTDSQALFFLSDNFYPGWKAKVNGKEAKIYRANYTFRAVEVPKGKSSVEFYYIPGI